MTLSELATDLADILAEAGDKSILVSNTLYFCLVSGKLAITTEPVGTVIYTIAALKALN